MFIYFLVSSYNLNDLCGILFQVVSHSTSPEWKEGFTWAFDVPPKGQKLHIQCKSRSTFGKVNGIQLHLTSNLTLLLYISNRLSLL